ncbi:AMP-binding protein [Uliginosibacterium sp. H3]|uniref:AMP-binding protein n=1 Tax=Uliginosibacterium silvisoli TaxID=3114758 RepID=A0ABU6K866_9RHOO|nr:AMP-binding protein [Uliginosibacterium sp. H3]
MLNIAASFSQFSDKPLLNLGTAEKSFAEIAQAAERIAVHLAEMPDASFVLCECTDVERYISVFSACVIADRTVVPFSTQKFSFEDLSEALPRFAYIDEAGNLSMHDGTGAAQRKSGDVYCLFTSGTTGKPKGILVNSGNLSAYVEGVSSFIPEYKTARNISAVFSPLFDLFYHDLLLAITYGLTLQFPTPRQRMTMADFVADRQIDIWFSTPTLAANILAARARTAASPQGAIPLSLFCGERLGAALAIEWGKSMNGDVINVYGPTETTIACTGERLDMSALDKDSDVSIGVPFGKNIASISDHGTLLISGAQVARYLHSTEVPFFDTKDLVKLEGGKYYFLGRADGQLKIKGIRIEKEELERVACAVPGVSYAKIQPILNSGLVAGFNVLVVGDAPARSISEAYKKRYGASLVPSGIQFVEEFETGTSGKAKV